MLKCNAPGCTTVENSEINGKSLTLFSFPSYDDSLVKKWEENSRTNNENNENKAELKLCELHFEPDSFVTDEKNLLAPGAVPTIFDHNNKRKIKAEERTYEAEEPPQKQKKLDENNVPSTASQNPEIKTESETVLNDQEKPAVNLTSGLTEQVENGADKKGGEDSIFAKQIDTRKRVYRLIIRIDKVIDKRDAKEEPKAVAKQASESKLQRSVNPVAKNNSVIKLCSKTGCKLTKTTLNSKPVFKCDRCGKYYVVKENKTDVRDLTCFICQEISPDPNSLSFHIRKHFTCDMCQAQCSTQISFDKHLRLHVSTDPLLPYKCHRCPDTFEVKADVRQHYADVHCKNVNQDKVAKKQSPSKVLFRCEYCYAVFKKEQAYKSHVELHMGDGEFDCALCSKRFRTAKHLATHQARHLGSLKFTCRVCSQEYSSLEEVEEHMKSHMEIIREEHKCNICKKIFKSESVLNSHMRGHLSRAHRCPLCKKAFINKTTLRIHFKTHSKAVPNPVNRDSIAKKRHACTLCQSAFDSRSRLYNHIMTHLEQMHGGEGGDVVFDELDELLESDEDVL